MGVSLGEAVAYWLGLDQVTRIRYQVCASFYAFSLSSDSSGDIP